MADTPAPVESHAEALRGTPPASNPGADDATAGIAPDAGGVSGAAHKDIENPATTAQKRRSVFGSVKGLFGLDKKSTTTQTPATSSTASDGTYLGAAAAAVTGTVAAVAEKVSTLTTGPTDGSKFASDAAATVLRDEDLEYVPSEKPTAETATTGATAAKDAAAADTKDVAAADSKDVAATEATSEPAVAAAESSETPDDDVVKTTPEDAVTADTEAQPVTTAAEEKKAEKEQITGEEGTEDGEHKPPQPAHNTKLTNPDAIPVAGGVKVGEEHAGESAIIPEDPLKPTAEEKSKGAVAAGESAVAENTAKNTGSATSGPGAVSTAAANEKATASPSSPGGESTKEKGKGLINKLKSKIKKNKE